MYYRPDYNMMLSLANVQRSRSRMETPYLQSGIDDLDRATQNQVNLQQLFNRQFNPVDNQYTNWAFGFPLRYDANHLEILKRNQLIQELEKLKMLLHRAEQNEEGVKQALRIEEIKNKKTSNVVFDENYQWKDMMKTKEWNLPQIVNIDKFQQSEIIAADEDSNADYCTKTLEQPNNNDEEKTSEYRPDSPCSNCSSGIGTMPSPLCDIQAPLEFEPRLLSSTPLPTAEEEIEPEYENLHPVKDIIMYQGRNVLDLHTNLTYQWSFQMAILPPHTLQTHFEYRSLYHRLGPYGLDEDWQEAKCPMCDFNTIIQKPESNQQQPQ